MRSTLSWKWLVPRLISRHLRNLPLGKRGTGRPCLALERLEQRNLLTANNAEIIGEPPGDTPIGADTQILIGLLANGAEVTQSEFDLIKKFADAAPSDTEAKIKFHDITFTKVVDKATPVLFQLNDTLIKFGEDIIIKGELTEKKLSDADNKIEYLKIKLEDILISSFNMEKDEADDLLKPLFDSADALITDLVSVSQRKAGKGQEEFIRLSEDILKIEDLAIKGELDFFKGGSPGLDVEDFQVKIDDVFQKASETFAKLKLNDLESVKLNEAIVAFQKEMDIKLLLGDTGGGVETDVGSLSAHGKFKGGIFIPPTDDTIT